MNETIDTFDIIYSRKEFFTNCVLRGRFFVEYMIARQLLNWVQLRIYDTENVLVHCFILCTCSLGYFFKVFFNGTMKDVVSFP